jgi:hypothetical protein
MTRIKESKSVISKKSIQEFVSTRKKLKDRGQSAVGELGVETKKFTDKNSLNKTGLMIFNRVNEMNAEKRKDVLRTFDALRDHFETEWGKQFDLALEGNEELEPEQDEAA